MSTVLPAGELPILSTAHLQRMRDHLAYIDAQAARSRCHQCNAPVTITDPFWRWNNARNQWEHRHVQSGYRDSDIWYFARVTVRSPTLYAGFSTRVLAYVPADIGRYTNDWLIVPSSSLAS